MFTFEPGNINSNAPAKTGLAVLTAPTELAHRKGNLKSHYPVFFHGAAYKDAEEAYQKTKRERVRTQAELVNHMARVLLARFKQYPDVLETVTRSGGVDFINKCTHHVTGRGRWEGDWRAGYLTALRQAYKAATCK